VPGPHKIKSAIGSNWDLLRYQRRVVEQYAMPTFLFWYAVFLAGSAVGATAGSSFGNGFAVVAGLLGGMAISGWIAESLSLNWSSGIYLAKPLLRPEQTSAVAQGLERIRFASSSQGLEASEVKGAERDTLGGAFSLPKGMYEFAMRKQSEKQKSSL
jgi:hypothetical protein